MKRVLLMSPVLVGLLVAFGSPAGAQDKKDVKKDDAKPTEITPAAKAVQNMNMAFRLVAYGREHKAPEALIAAARVIGTTGLKNPEKDDYKNPADLKPYDQLKEAGDLLAEAVKLAPDSAEIKKLAEATRKIIAERPRGAEFGPRVFQGFIGPGSTRTYQIRFVIGQLATISVRNIGQTDLDLYAQCNRSGWTTHDRRVNQDAFVAFTVGSISTDGFTVRVVNYSTNRGTAFVLFTN